MILSIIAILVTFGLVIFLHELGHFLVCRWIDVAVERFAFGFGPELVGFTRGETRYSICAFPLGGFVKPAGESPDEATGNPREYFAKPWNQRLGIVAAGPFMNYFLAWVLFSGLAFWRGDAVPLEAPVIGEIAAGMPADAAGLKAGDRITWVNGAKIGAWKELAQVIHASSDKPVRLDYDRKEGESIVHGSVLVTPVHDAGLGRGMIGISPEVEYSKVGLGTALWEGVESCWNWTRYTVTSLAQKIHRREKPDLAGPVGIVQMVSKAAHSGLEDLIFLIALISVAVGFFNILPIPLLDGGHGAFYLYEGLTRRKPTQEAMNVANSIGLAFLLGVLLFSTYNDVVRMRKSPWKAKSKPAAEATQPASSVPEESPAR